MFKQSFFREEEIAYLKKRSSQIVSVFLAVLMVLSSFVWAPEMFTKAEAAEAGKYTVKAYVHVSEAGRDDIANYAKLASEPVFQFRVYYHKNNGVDTAEYYQDFSVTTTAASPNSSYTCDLSYEDVRDIPGFPYKATVSVTYTGTNAEGDCIGSGKGYYNKKWGIRYTTEVNLQVKNLNDNSYVALTDDLTSLNVNITNNEQDTGGGVNSKTFSNVSLNFKSNISSLKPKITTVNWTSGENITFDLKDVGTDAGAKSTAQSIGSATVYDQYGVVWYQDPTYRMVSTNSSTASGDWSATSDKYTGIFFSTDTSANTSSVQVSRDARELMPGEQSTTRWIVASCGGVNSVTRMVTVKNYDVTATFSLGSGTKAQNYYWGNDTSEAGHKPKSVSGPWGFYLIDTPTDANGNIGYEFKNLMCTEEINNFFKLDTLNAQNVATEDVSFANYPAKNGMCIAPSSTATTEVQFIAQWTPQNIVEFYNSDGQQLDSSNIKRYTNGKYSIRQAVEDFTFSFSYPGGSGAAVKNYVFAGWMVSSCPEHPEWEGQLYNDEFGSSLFDSDNVTDPFIKFIAVYKASTSEEDLQKYTVNFKDANGNSVASETGVFWTPVTAYNDNDKTTLKQGTAGSAVTTLNGFDLNNFDYTFVGWSTKKPKDGNWFEVTGEDDDKVEYKPGSTYRIKSNASLYPCYSKAKKQCEINMIYYTSAITVAGKNVPASKLTEIGNTIDLGYPARRDFNNGEYTYTFIGWTKVSDDTSGSPLPYEDGDGNFIERTPDVPYSAETGKAEITLTGHATYCAVYRRDPITYIAHYYNYDGTALFDTAALDKYSSGTTLKQYTPATQFTKELPSRDTFNAVGYKFVGWVRSDDAVPDEADLINPDESKLVKKGDSYTIGTESPSFYAAYESYDYYTVTFRNEKFENLSSFDGYFNYEVNVENGYSSDDNDNLISYTAEIPEGTTDAHSYIPVVADQKDSVAYQNTFVGWRSSVSSENIYSFETEEKDEAGNPKTESYAIPKLLFNNTTKELEPVPDDQADIRNITVTGNRTYTAVFKKETRVYDISLYGVDVNPKLKVNEDGYGMYTYDGENYFTRNSKIYTYSEADGYKPIEDITLSFEDALEIYLKKSDPVVTVTDSSGKVYTKYTHSDGTTDTVYYVSESEKKVYASEDETTFTEYDVKQAAVYNWAVNNVLTAVKPEPIKVLTLKYNAYILDAVKELYQNASGTLVTDPAEVSKIAGQELKIVPYGSTEKVGLPYGTDQYEYSFKGWSPALTATAQVTGDASYVASYNTDNVKYDVHWYIPDGHTGTTKDNIQPTGTYTEFGKSTYRYKRVISTYKTTPTAADVPVPEGVGEIDNYVWSFLGWYECDVTKNADGSIASWTTRKQTVAVDTVDEADKNGDYTKYVAKASDDAGNIIYYVKDGAVYDSTFAPLTENVKVYETSKNAIKSFLTAVEPEVITDGFKKYVSNADGKEYYVKEGQVYTCEVVSDTNVFTQTNDVEVFVTPAKALSDYLKPAALQDVKFRKGTIADPGTNHNRDFYYVAKFGYVPMDYRIDIMDDVEVSEGVTEEQIVKSYYGTYDGTVYMDSFSMPVTADNHYIFKGFAYTKGATETPEYLAATEGADKSEYTMADIIDNAVLEDGVSYVKLYKVFKEEAHDTDLCIRLLQPTYEKDGLERHYCSVCGYYAKENESSDNLENIEADGKYYVAIPKLIDKDDDNTVPVGKIYIKAYEWDSESDGTDKAYIRADTLISIVAADSGYMEGIYLNGEGEAVKDIIVEGEPVTVSASAADVKYPAGRGIKSITYQWYHTTENEAGEYTGKVEYGDPVTKEFSEYESVYANFDLQLHEGFTAGDRLEVTVEGYGGNTFEMKTGRLYIDALKPDVELVKSCGSFIIKIKEAYYNRYEATDGENNKVTLTEIPGPFAEDGEYAGYDKVYKLDPAEGKYKITVYDNAGNMAKLDFEIEEGHKFNAGVVETEPKCEIYLKDENGKTVKDDLGNPIVIYAEDDSYLIPTVVEGEYVYDDEGNMTGTTVPIDEAFKVANFYGQSVKTCEYCGQQIVTYIYPTHQWNVNAYKKGEETDPDDGRIIVGEDEYVPYIYTSVTPNAKGVVNPDGSHYVYKTEYVYKLGDKYYTINYSEDNLETDDVNEAEIPVIEEAAVTVGAILTPEFTVDIFTVDKAAKCESYNEDGTIKDTGEGSKSVHCTVCSAKRDVTVIPKLEHDWTKRTTKKPTCTENGEQKLTCKRCKYEKTVTYEKTDDGEELYPELKATGHTLETGGNASVAGYIKQENLEKYFANYEAENGTAYVSQYDGEEGANKYSGWVLDKYPNCTEEGKMHRLCAVCKSRIDDVTIPANGHDFSIELATGTYCMEYPKTAEHPEGDSSLAPLTYSLKQCSVCGEKQESINEHLKNHDFDPEHGATVKTIPATCAEEEIFIYTCARDACNKTQVKPGLNGQKAHNWVLTDEPTLASCTTQGLKVYTCILKYKNKEDSGEIISYTDYNALTPEQQENYEIFEGCKEVIGYTNEPDVAKRTKKSDTKTNTYKYPVYGTNPATRTEKVAALGHNWDKGTVTKEPTCFEIGEMTFKCTNILYYVEKDNEDAEPLSVTKYGQLSEGEKEAYKAVTCSDVDPKGTRIEYLDKNTDLHKFNRDIDGNIIYETYVAPTCTENGVGTAKCIGECGEVVVIDIPALGHKQADGDEGEYTEATCTEYGFTEYKCVNIIGYKKGEDTITVAEYLKLDEGDKEGYEAVLCGETIKVIDETVEPAHDFDETITENVNVIKESTCVEDGSMEVKCSKCDEIKTVTIPADPDDMSKHDLEITEQGECVDGEGHRYIQQSCKVCEKVYTEYDDLKDLKHDFTDVPEVTVSNATCIANRKYTKTCTVCEEVVSFEEEDSMTGHTEAEPVRENEIAETCKTVGSYEKVIYCAICEVEISRVTIEIPVHEADSVLDTEKTTEATCTEGGEYFYKCSKCGIEIEELHELKDALKHDFNDKIAENVEIKDATCIDAGYKKVKCSRCDEIQNTPIEALGHDFVNVPFTEKGKEATCTEYGLLYKKCSRCTREISERIAPVDGGHKWVKDDSKEENKSATCAVEGVQWYKCSNVLEYKKGEEVISASAYSKLSAEDKEGYEPSVYCGETKKVVLPKDDNHNYTEKVIAATCTEDKVTEYTCTTCKDAYKVIDRFSNLEHEWETEVDENGVTVRKYTVDIPATCTTVGKESVHCIHPGCKVTTGEREIPVGGHKFSVETVLVAATCHAEGLRLVVCSNEGCMETYYRRADDVKGDATTDFKTEKDDTYTVEFKAPAMKIETIGKTEHNFTIVTETKNPTCTEAGEKTLKCANEGCTETTTEAIDPLGHEFDKTTPIGHTDATCKAYEATVYKCIRCEQTETVYGTEYAEHTAGTLVKVEKAVTCTENGIEIYNCSVCGQTMTVTVKAPGSHDYDDTIEANVDLKPATCTEDGYKKVKCSRCDDVKTAETYTAIGSHDYDETITANVELKKATCTEAGYKKVKCSRCDDVKTVETYEALEHDWITDEAVAPTCAKVGREEGKHCSRCDEKVIGAEIPATGKHTKGELLAVKIEATCVTKGLELYKCSVCGGSFEFETEPNENAHKFDIWSQYTNKDPLGKAATCTEPGIVVSRRKCLNEGCTLDADDTLLMRTDVEQPLGHNYQPVPETITNPDGSKTIVTKYICSRCTVENKSAEESVNKYLVTVLVDGREPATLDNLITEGGSLRLSDLEAIYTPRIDEENGTREEIEWLVNGVKISLPYVVSSNLTVTGKITNVYMNYTVKFTNKNGKVISSKEYIKGAKVEVPANLNLGDKYEFLGWQIDKDHQYKPDEIPAVTGDVTYSPWYDIKTTDPVYYVTFKNDTGTRTLNFATVIEQERVDKPVDPVKSYNTVYHYTFKGWVTEKGNGKTLFDFNKGIVKNITLYAYFETATHNEASKTVVKNVGCKQDEVTRYTCTCGYEYERTTRYATGHTPSIIDTSEDGTVITYKCKVCSETWTKTKTASGELEDAIVVIVKDNNGAPLAGATVKIYVKGTDYITAKTDKNGKAYFEKYDELLNPNGLKDGTYSTVISAANYDDSKGTIRISNGTGSEKLSLKKPECHCICHAGNFFSKIKKFFSNFIRIFDKSYRCCPDEEGF